MGDDVRYAFLGWQGFGLEHPADWELNRIRGGRRESYLALDDGDTVRLEINWKPVKRKTPIQAVCDRQERMLRKTAGRRRMTLDVKRNVKLGRVKGFEHEAFTWDGDVSACELIARCRRCSRGLLVRVVGKAGKPPLDVAKHVFRSLECYCEKDSECWGTFGLAVWVPSRFELEHSALKAGMCELTFSDKRVELHVIRVSMGRAILEEHKMVPWFENLKAKLLRPFRMTWEEASFRGHIGYRGDGKVGGDRRLLSIFRNPRALRAQCFYCEETDKIFAVVADGTRNLDDLVDEVLEGLKCHG